jgi:hypothetical protein
MDYYYFTQKTQSSSQLNKIDNTLSYVAIMLKTHKIVFSFKMALFVFFYR